MEQNLFDCICKQKVKIQDIKQHIQDCFQYQQSTPFYFIFKDLPLNDLDNSQLQALKIEFQMYIEDIDLQLKQKQYQYPQSIETINSSEIDQQLQISQETGSISENTGLVQCLSCKEKFYSFQTEEFYYIQPCEDLVCRTCLRKHILKEFQEKGQVICLKQNCKSYLQEFDMQILMGQDEFYQMNQQYQQNQIDSLLNNDNIVECINCKGHFEFQKGKIDLNQKDDQNKKLTHDACVDFFENRFNCIQCKTEQCKNCKVTPFHKGLTCQQYAKNKLLKKCKFCLQIKCSDKECVQRRKNQCQKKYPTCNHECFGVINENQCPDCLTCNNTENDFCNICMIEGLGQAPIIQSKCGHSFHYHCVKKNLDLKWFQPRITFGFLFCPLCKAKFEFQEQTIQNQVQESSNLYDIVQDKALKRLEFEKRLNDDKLKNQDSQFFQNPKKYSMAIYSYYMCFKCKEPYYGGLKDCERAIEENQQQEYKQEDLICPTCCPIAVDSCKIKGHGKDYIQWKCKFCCSIAVFFCWGNTHFCDACHKRQCSGDYMNKKKKSDLPKCPGPDKCPLKTVHVENGEESCLGCQLCLNHKQNQIDF